MEIKSQEEWVLHRLDKFYSNPENFKTISDIISGNSKISLRLIDWFSTNYSKKYNVSYISKSGKHVIVYLSYKAHLKAYSKRMFDPFCRWKRINFKEINTTVGQLNFFEWAIKDEILEYLEKNYDEVHNDMEQRLSETKSYSDGKKRQELSKSATRNIVTHNLKASVEF